MKYHRLSGFLLLLLFAMQASGQTPLPYFTGFDTPAQKQGWTLFRGGSQTSSTWQFNNATAYSAPSSLVHYYPVGGSQLTDDWYISPGFNIPAGGKLDSIRHRFSGFGVPNAGDTLALYLLVGSANPNTATSKILLKDFRGADYQIDGNWNNTEGITLPSTPGTCYLAIRYATVINWLDVFFDNIRISGNPSTGIGEAAREHEPTAAFRLHPNPARDYIRITGASKQDAVIILDVLGKKLWSGTYGEGLDTSTLPDGFYLVGLQTLKTGYIVRKFYKK